MSGTPKEPWRPKTTADRVKLMLGVALFYIGIIGLFRWIHPWIEPIDPRWLGSSLGLLIVVAGGYGALVGWVAGLTPASLSYWWRFYGSMNWLLLMQFDRIRIDRPIMGNLGAAVSLLLMSLMWAGIWGWIDRLVAPTWKGRGKPPTAAE